MKKDYIIYLLGIGLLIFLFSNFFYRRSNRQILEKSGMISHGTITPYGSDFICNYNVKGKSYKFKRSHPYPYLQEGEKYKLAYEKGNPKNAIVLFHEPILEGVYLEGLTTDVAQSINNNILFHFNTDIGEIERYNKARPNYKIDESKSYKVKYLKENPKVAYLIY